MLGFNPLQFRIEVFPQLRNMWNQAVELAQEFDGHGAGQRAAAESCAVQAGMNTTGNAIGCQQRAKWQSGGERFRYRYYVGRDLVMLICKIFPGTPKSGLNFIEQQQGAGFLRQLTCQLQE